ncbi:RNA polymerase II transcription factor SIII subunit A-domain-containing protein [Morchella snyderi]|nr:RNA polymerase II transcription factor SIII subunit A-domain-containing protein [Morchella snyderi]
MPTPQGPTKSLYALCKNVLIKYVDTIDDVGDIDYDLLRPILLKITSPPQLKKLELNCPHLLPHTSEIWHKLITRDFGAAALPKRSPPSSAPHAWARVYEKHFADSQAASEASAKALREQMSSLKNAKASQRARMVTNTSGLPPTGRRPGTGWGRPSDSWAVKAGSKTKNIVQKARREAKEVGKFLGRNSRLAAPTHTLGRAEVSRTMREKIKDPVVLPEREVAGGSAVAADGKRRREDDGEEGDVDVDERTKSWIGGGAKRVAVGRLNRPGASAGAAGAQQQQQQVRQRVEADPFMRRKPAAGARR